MQRTSSTALLVLGIIQIVGWIAVAAGIVLFLTASGGDTGLARSRGVPIEARLVLALPGVVGGLILVALAQVGSAIVSIANGLADEISRERPTPAWPADRVAIHNGAEIVRRGDKYLAVGQECDSLAAAKGEIDQWRYRR